MRISDWSSDVCSSDLFDVLLQPRRLRRVVGVEVLVVQRQVVDADVGELEVVRRQLLDRLGQHAVERVLAQAADEYRDLGLGHGNCSIEGRIPRLSAPVRKWRVKDGRDRSARDALPAQASVSAAATISSSDGITRNAAPASGVNVSAPTTRRNGRAPKPPSTTAVMMPSPTPALRRPSSTIRMRFALAACSRMKASLSGTSQRRSTTRTFQPCLPSIAFAARRLIGTPLPKVKMTRSSLPSP